MANTKLAYPHSSFVVGGMSSEALMVTCGFEPECLPMAYLSDWRFQVFITEYGDMPNPDDANYRRYYVGIIDHNQCGGDIPTTLRYGGNELTFIDLSMHPITMPNGQVIKGVLNLNNVPNPFVQIVYSEFEEGEWQPEQITPIAVGECFRLSIWEDIIAEDTDDVVLQRRVISCTNCFVKVEPDNCYHSYFSYSCNENSYGFLYNVFVGDPRNGVTASFKNYGYLPFYLHSPNLPSEEKSYKKSDGTNIKLYERVDEEFTLETDYMDSRLHKCMKVMLGSDDLQIFNDYFRLKESVDFICKESYDIAWEKIKQKPMQRAKATTKVLNKYPLYLLNANCK